MIHLRITELLKERGDKTLYWLAEQSGMKYSGLWKIVNNRNAGVRFNTLDSICEVFDCTLSELLVRDEDRVSQPKADLARRRRSRKAHGEKR